jgi:integrase
MTIRGRIRRRGRKLEAVISLGGGRKVRRFSTGCSVGQEAEAERVLVEALEAIRSAHVTAARTGELTVRVWGKRWIAGRGEKVSSSEEAALLEHHVYPEIGDVPLSALTKSRMLDFVKALPRHVAARTGRPISPRTIHHVADVTRRCLGEAVDRELLATNPCAWRAKRDLPAKRDVSATMREEGGIEADELARLLADPSIPLLRRALYAGLALAGPRPGELLARRVRDLEASWAPLPLLRAPTGWNTKARREGPTKTGAKKYLPVHPAWHSLLSEWIAEGWARYVGREPEPGDFLFPTESGLEPLAGYNLNRWFKEDLERLGLPAGRSVYALRSTFVSLAEAGGATREQIRLITHPSPVQAFDFYARLRLVWPERCRVVLAIRLPSPLGGVAEGVTAAGPEKENARNVVALRAFEGVGAAGFEPATPAV